MLYRALNFRIGGDEILGLDRCEVEAAFFRPIHLFAISTAALSEESQLRIKPSLREFRK